MARPAGGNVHIGKAAAIIVAAVLLGALVLYKHDSGIDLSASSNSGSTSNNVTPTTAGSNSGDQDLTTTTVAARQPATVKVIAVNATNASGIAGRATTRLQTAGYNAISPGNATAAYKAGNPTTIVYIVTPGYDREAAAIATLFGLPSSSVKALPATSPSTDIKDVNVAVVIGSGLAI